MKQARRMGTCAYMLYDSRLRVGAEEEEREEGGEGEETRMHPESSLHVEQRHLVLSDTDLDRRSPVTRLCVCACSTRVCVYICAHVTHRSARARIYIYMYIYRDTAIDR